MKLKLGYFAVGKMIGVDCRVTAEDVKGDGSVPLLHHALPPSPLLPHSPPREC